MTALGILGGHRPRRRALGASADVTALQTQANTWLKANGYKTITVDGNLGPATCGAALAAGLDPPSTCTAYTAPTADPNAAAVSASTTNTTQMQTLLNNEVLVPEGFQPVPVTGSLDAVTCGAASAVLAAVKAQRVKVSTTLAALLSDQMLSLNCASYLPWVDPAKSVATPVPSSVPLTAGAAPAPVPATSSTLCNIDFGNRSAVILQMQGYLNTLLDKNGYQPIPTTGVWDDATCGALYAVGGQFDPTIATCGGGNWTVPARCPTQTLPKKKATSTVSGGMALTGVFAALAVAGAFVIKKKGLLG